MNEPSAFSTTAPLAGPVTTVRRQRVAVGVGVVAEHAAVPAPPA